MSFGIHSLLSDREVSVDLLLRLNVSLHPWMGQYFSDSWSLSWVERHHLLEEVLELRRVDIVALLSFCVRLPEELSAASGDEAIVGVLRVC